MLLTRNWLVLGWCGNSCSWNFRDRGDLASKTHEPISVSKENIRGSVCLHLEISHVPRCEGVLDRLVAFDEFFKALLLTEGGWLVCVPFLTSDASAAGR